MFNKKSRAAAMALSLALAANVSAELSMSATLTTDYIFRGYSQTAEDPAGYVSLDYEHKSGAYLGTWVANVDFTDGKSVAGSSVDFEQDFYLGFKGKISSAINYDAGYIYYSYPGANRADEFDFGEFYIGISYQDLSVKYGYSNDFADSDEAGHYIDANYDFELPQELTLTLHLGNSFGDVWDDVALVEASNYWDYALTLSRTWTDIDFSLAYINTDLSGADKIDSGVNANDGRVVFSLQKSM